jgi:ribosomal protein S18 acetylase RimI-like enzyme
MKRYPVIKVALLSISVALGGGIAYYVMRDRVEIAQGPIYDYNEQRDKEAIKKIFMDNWYWLTVHEQDPAYPEYIFSTNSPNDWEPQYIGQLHVKVLREGSDLVGFVAYHKLNFYEGKVLFLAIDKRFRGKHYGEQLLRAAIADLRKLGSKQVWLVTRVDNKSAIKLYKRSGLIETGVEGGFVHFLQLLV